MSSPFIAQISIFGGNFAPRGWSTCNGQILPIAQNTALFSLLGTTYGGDGRVTFGLPNLQGRAPLGQGNGPGLSPYQLGQAAGTENVTLTVSEIPQHNHTATVSLGPGNANNPSATDYLGPGNNSSAFIYGPGSNPLNQQMLGSVLPNAGGSQPHNNMQPFLTLTFIIALQGVFPPRS